MAVPISLSLSKLHFLPNPKQTQFSFTHKDPNFIFFTRKKTHFPAPIISNLKNVAAILGFSGLAFTTLMVGSASGSELGLMGSSSFQFNEPSNALSLHTWASHVSTIVEWVTAMALVWKYGEKSGYESWKGLSWGMVFSTKIHDLNLFMTCCPTVKCFIESGGGKHVPLLGGALCACTWHFFYNSESVEVVVALQAALTVIGNATMCFAAFRIYRSTQNQSKEL